MPEDAADRHVARWRDHWVLDEPFDETTEAIVVRMMRIVRYFGQDTKETATSVGLVPHEYDTLHHLMIRETPGRASPNELATATGVTPAGMTGRLDSMEKAGYLRRTHDQDDRRRTLVEVTDEGLARWRRAMASRGHTEHSLLANLEEHERATLAALLKQLTLAIEEPGPPAS